MKSSRLFGTVLVVCVLFSSFGPCQAQQYSPEFQALLNQIQQNYLSPRGDNLSSMRNQYPNVVAALVGHALRQQAVHVQQNPSLNNRFASLQQQAQVYITDVARTTSSRVRNEDGSPVTPESLWFVVNKFYQGQEDAWIWQNFRVQTGTMPSVLASRSGSEQQRRPVNDPYVKADEKNQIELFGIGAPSVKGPDNCDNAALYYSDQCKWYRQQKEAQAEAERQKSKALNPDGITGTWSFGSKKNALKIWKQGDVYFGSVNDFVDRLKRNEICLRLKYAGAGKDGPVYKGQHLSGRGAAGNIFEWEDITFYYYLSWGKAVFSAAPSGNPAILRFGRP
jgi:hypothetical protein